MRKVIILFSVFFLFLSCETVSPPNISVGKKDNLLTPEQRKATTDARIKARYEYLRKMAATKYTVDLIKHPDYSFEAKKTGNIIVYDGFEPKKEYLVIGKISIIQLPDADVEWIKKDVEKNVLETGGNAILITEKKIGKKVNRETIGVFMPKSLLKYFQITTEKEKISTISYYGYIIRWIEE